MTLEALLGSHPWVVLAAVLYGTAAVVSAAAVVQRWRGRKAGAGDRRGVALELLGLAVLAAAFAVNTVLIAGRWVEAGRPPFKTLFETMLFYPWCVAVVTFVLIGLHRLTILIPFSAAVALLGLGYALYRPDVELVNLPPALQSGWFVPHVVIYFISYAGLFASCVLALLALLVPGRAGPPAAEGGSPEAGFALYAHRAAVFGVSALTMGLVMGAAWGKFAWGDYWSWDPKENWALVTWLAYMIYLHLRRMPGWQGAGGMWLLVVSFGAVVFTYLGMNLLPTAGGSLHVYQ